MMMMNYEQLDTFKLRAEELFVKKHYKEAMQIYSDILASYDEDKEARIGVLLCDLAQDHEEEAQALHDYYRIVKEENPFDAEEMLEGFIKGFDGGIEQVAVMMESAISERYEQFEGILYRDFKSIVKNRGGFRRAFEDLMYSTKIILSGREEFYEFLTDLVENGFEELALRYMENSTDTLSHDLRLRSIIEKIHKPIL